MNLTTLTDDELISLYKKKENEVSKYNNLQMSRKIALNSAYGILANQYCRYYNIQMAEGITLSGQLSIRWIARKLNECINKILNTNDIEYVVYVDTDSNFICLKGIADKYCQGKTKDETREYLNKFANEILSPFIKKSYVELAEYMNAENHMVMKLETIADSTIWLAKKMYIMNMLENEGIVYSEPKLKMKGISAVRSGTPAVCRKELTKALKTIMTGDKDRLIKEVSEFKELFCKMEPNKIATPTSVNGISEYGSRETIYRKATPIHVRGSLLYNFWIKERHIENDNMEIFDGDKIRYLYLKMPNPIKENVIAFHQDLPKELMLHEYIDYNRQFDKTFVASLQLILDAIKWDISNRKTLEEFFI